MAVAITRAQVREAMINSSCPVPDFKTREKATLVWSKVYISLDGPELRFVELNFFQRGIRYFVGCICYGDTVFKDIEKETLEKVKEYIHGIKTEPTYLDSIAMDLFPKVQTRGDYYCLIQMLNYHRPEGGFEEDLHNVTREVNTKLDLAGLEEGFSEEFLSAALVVARENLKQNPNDAMWEAIRMVLSDSRDYEGAQLNEKLLREIMGQEVESAIIPRQIVVQGEIAVAIQEGVERVTGTFDRIRRSDTLEGQLDVIALLEGLNQELSNPGEFIEPFLTKPSGERMLQDFRARLIDGNAHPALINAYLNDKEQRANRLYSVSDVETLNRARISNCQRAVQARIKEFKRAVLETLNNSYGVTDLGYQTDSFSASCDHFRDDYQKGMDRSWRETIADKLLSNGSFRTLIENRIKEERDLKGFTVERYCQWIRDPKSPVGPPELKVLSGMTGRPVLVVKFVSGNFNWMDGINLDFDEAPLIFNVDWTVWSPVEKI